MRFWGPRYRSSCCCVARALPTGPRPTPLAPLLCLWLLTDVEKQPYKSQHNTPDALIPWVSSTQRTFSHASESRWWHHLWFSWLSSCGANPEKSPLNLLNVLLPHFVYSRMPFCSFVKCHFTKRGALPLVLFSHMETVFTSLRNCPFPPCLPVGPRHPRPTLRLRPDDKCNLLPIVLYTFFLATVSGTDHGSVIDSWLMPASQPLWHQTVLLDIQGSIFGSP